MFSLAVAPTPLRSSTASPLREAMPIRDQMAAAASTMTKALPPSSAASSSVIVLLSQGAPAAARFTTPIPLLPSPTAPSETTQPYLAVPLGTSRPHPFSSIAPSKIIWPVETAARFTMPLPRPLLPTVQSATIRPERGVRSITLVPLLSLSPTASSGTTQQA